MIAAVGAPARAAFAARPDAMTQGVSDLGFMTPGVFGVRVYGLKAEGVLGFRVYDPRCFWGLRHRA